jgi:hypothetical protein
LLLNFRPLAIAELVFLTSQALDYCGDVADSDSAFCFAISTARSCTSLKPEVMRFEGGIRFEGSAPIEAPMVPRSDFWIIKDIVFLKTEDSLTGEGAGFRFSHSNNSFGCGKLSGPAN